MNSTIDSESYPQVHTCTVTQAVYTVGVGNY